MNNITQYNTHVAVALAGAGALSIGLPQKLFSNADGFWSHFNVFIVINILERSLKVHVDWWGQANGIIRTARAHVGELLSFGWVHRHGVL